MAIVVFFNYTTNMPREVITNPNYISDFANIAQVYYRVNNAILTEIWKLYFQNAIRWTKPVGTITAGVNFPFSQYGTITINRTSEDPYSTNGQISSGTKIRYGDSITATFTLPSDYNFITIERPIYSISHPTSSVVINNNTFNIHYVPWSNDNFSMTPTYWGYDHTKDKVIFIGKAKNQNPFNIVASASNTFDGLTTMEILKNSDRSVTLPIGNYTNFKADSYNKADFTFYYGYPDYNVNKIVRYTGIYSDVVCALTAPRLAAQLASTNDNTISVGITDTTPYSGFIGNKTLRVKNWKDSSTAEVMRIGYTLGTTGKTFKMASYPLVFKETTLHPQLYATADYYPTTILGKSEDSRIVQVDIPWKQGVITPYNGTTNTDCYHLDNPNAIRVSYTLTGRHNLLNVNETGTIAADGRKDFLTDIYTSPRADLDFNISYVEAKDGQTYNYLTEYKKGWYYEDGDLGTPPSWSFPSWDWDIEQWCYIYHIDLYNYREDGNTGYMASSAQGANKIELPAKQKVAWEFRSQKLSTLPTIGNQTITITGYYFYPDPLYAQIKKEFVLSAPTVSTPTFILTPGVRGEVGYTLTNNDSSTRNYAIQGIRYKGFLVTGVTGTIAGNATITGTLTVDSDFGETTTKPRFNAYTSLLTKVSQTTSTLVGETTFEPLEFHESSSTIAPISWTIWGSHLNHAEFDYNVTGTVFNRSVNVSGTKLKHNIIANFFSVNSDTLPSGVIAVQDMKKHYALTCKLTYTDTATNEYKEIVSTYTKGGVFTSDNIAVQDSYYTRNWSNYYYDRVLILRNTAGIDVNYKEGTTMKPLRRNATIQLTDSVSTNSIKTINFYYTNVSSSIAYTKQFGYPVAPALIPNLSASLVDTGSTTVNKYKVSYSITDNRSQKGLPMKYLKANNGKKIITCGTGSGIMNQPCTGEVSLVDIVNNVQSLKLILNATVKTDTNTESSNSNTVTINIPFREPSVLLQSGLWAVLVYNYNPFTVTATWTGHVNHIGFSSSGTISRGGNLTAKKYDSSAQVYTKVTFTIRDSNTGKTETVSASQSNYTIRSLTARGRPWIVEEEQSIYVAYNNPNSYLLTVTIIQRRYNSNGTISGTRSQTKNIPANDWMEFTFQDSGVYQEFVVEYTTDGYVRGTGPTQTYGRL